MVLEIILYYSSILIWRLEVGACFTISIEQGQGSDRWRSREAMCCNVILYYLIASLNTMQVQYGTSIARCYACTMEGKVKVGMCVVRINDCACVRAYSQYKYYEHV